MKGPAVTIAQKQFVLNEDHHLHCHDKAFAQFLDSVLSSFFAWLISHSHNEWLEYLQIRPSVHMIFVGFAQDFIDAQKFGYKRLFACGDHYKSISRVASLQELLPLMYKATAFSGKQTQSPALPPCIYYDLLQEMDTYIGREYTSSQLTSTRVLNRVAEVEISLDFLGKSGKEEGQRNSNSFSFYYNGSCYNGSWYDQEDSHRPDQLKQVFPTGLVTV